MIAKLACLLALVAACTDGADVLDFDNRAEAGSEWHFDFGSGSQMPPFTGTCPSFAPRTLHVPNQEMPCDPGCTCSFTLWVSDMDGLVTESEQLSIEFLEHCSDGSDLHSFADIAPSTTNGVFAFWHSATHDANDLVDDCAYPLVLDVAFDP